MNPSVPDRLSSVVRALAGVVLPALPADASLAREQAMLAIGQVQIVLAQLDATPQFEREEAQDLAELARTAALNADGGPQTTAARDAVLALLPTLEGRLAREATHHAQEAIDSLLIALVADGSDRAIINVRRVVIEAGAARALKDRTWFAAMGFDIDLSAKQ